ncbi:MAG TPA: glycosyltransferase [Chloroflexota bacterium]|nr:glycosyltransferase [Chloroflexota bacterium]
MPARRFLILVSDRLSEIVRKGEVVERFYNPGNLFRDVHILLTNDDEPNPATLQPMVGDAQLHLHNLPSPSFRRTVGWQRPLLESWLAAGVRLAETIQPNLIRCYGLSLNAVLAAHIRRATGIPSVVSLHGNPDVDYGRLARTPVEKLTHWRLAQLQESAIQAFDHVIAVYSPIVPYCESRRLQSYSVIYNAVGVGARPKSDYRLVGGKLRCVCVGRQQSREKDQRAILRALAIAPNTELTLFGNGDLHDELQRLSQELGIASRVRFELGTPNHQLMQELCGFDVYVYNSINFEISKTVIEAALIGLPIVLNERQPRLADELQHDFILKVPDSPEGYAAGLSQLARDEQMRRRMGQEARAYARSHWSPEASEAKVAALYRQFLA